MEKNTGSAAMQTIIGEGSDLFGDYVFQGPVVVHGHIKGNLIAVNTSGAVAVIAKSGKVEGEVRAAIVEVVGSVIGDVYSSERLSLMSGCNLRGNIYYKGIEVAEGAVINGNMISEK
ncbi:MAG: polymer-forming cytoskeletal protein [Gammaproteobacteria bacterium]|nr:polymer-forming cytoskeletal protein [Gammaproteobacteria bacterium]MBU1653449.1 polymer-forming cytoskeletal protein [Gammaproteobacteria bacterium]MBU1961917.1 polymer-forming cytoskeletal protein [Gammaproteobacteria bacterium]